MAPETSWRIPRPVQKGLQTLAAVCESAAQQSARKLGLDHAEIRSMPHPTTRRNGKILKIQNHITMYWSRLLADGTYKREKEGELFLDAKSTRLLEDHEIDDNTKNINNTADDVEKNPHTWGS